MIHYRQIFLLLLSIVLLQSCVNNKIEIFSNNRYKPIPKVETNSYKSPQLRAGQKENTALGIAISGGGSRAQYFGLGVLIGLDEISTGKSTFLNEVDYFSTVSGGGFAAGYYMTLKKNGVLADFPSLIEFWKSDARKITLQEFMAKDAGISSVLKLFKYEKNKISHPYPTMIDEELLQLGKVYKNKTVERLYLKDFFIPLGSTARVTLPMFVTNGTIYNNGERLPFMPHIIDYLKIQNSLLPEEAFNIDHGYGLPMSYAISGSAAFPGILPMLKFSISDTDKVIRVIDGGVVDNLGFTTLFELLNADKVENKDKKALIIDCGGFGKEVQQQTAGKVRIGSLLQRSLLYTVDINLLYSDIHIKHLADYYHFESGNIVRIGFLTIKDKFMALEKVADTASINNITQLKKDIEDHKMNWEDVYKDFASAPIFKGYSVHNISEIPAEQFLNLALREVFELFELSSQVETKIKIFPWEKEILILAGRYSVFLKENIIKGLLN